MTQERLELYTKDEKNDKSQDLYKSVTNDAKVVWDKTKAAPGNIKNVWETGKKLVNKIKK